MRPVGAEALIRGLPTRRGTDQIKKGVRKDSGLGQRQGAVATRLVTATPSFPTPGRAGRRSEGGDDPNTLPGWTQQDGARPAVRNFPTVTVAP